MRRIDRETAAAFGDEPSRDIEAEFGATATAADRAAVTASLFSAVKRGAASVAAVAKPVGGGLTVKAPTKPVSATVSMQAPKLAVMAPPPVPAPSPKPVQPPKPIGGSIGLTPPSASGKAALATVSSITPAQLAAGKASEGARVATSAMQGNFLDGGGAPLAVPTVKPPAGTIVMTQAERDANARALAKAKQLQLAEANAAYARQRQLDTASAMATVTDGIKQPWERAGVDVGQIVMGAKVIAVGASIIASGGAVAGAVGLTGAGASLATAAAADRLVAAVEQGGEIGKKAKAVIDDVKSAAKKGEAAAKEALSTIEGVMNTRIDLGVPAGAVRDLTAAGKKALSTLEAAVSTGLDAKVIANMAAAASAARPTSAGYAMAPLSNSNAVVVSNRPAGAVQLSTLQLETVRPRWLVTDAGKVSNLDTTPSAASARGLVVWTTGKVVRQ